MIAFRKAHPSIARSRFWREDVGWYGVSQTPDLSSNSHTLAYRLRGTSQHDIDVYVMINGYWEDLTFVIQQGQAAEWRRVIDTSQPAPLDFREVDDAECLGSLACNVRARSIIVLVKA